MEERRIGIVPFEEIALMFGRGETVLRRRDVLVGMIER